MCEFFNVNLIDINNFKIKKRFKFSLSFFPRDIHDNYDLIIKYIITYLFRNYLIINQQQSNNLNEYNGRPDFKLINLKNHRDILGIEIKNDKDSLRINQLEYMINNKNFMHFFILNIERDYKNIDKTDNAYINKKETLNDIIRRFKSEELIFNNYKQITDFLSRI